MNDFAHIARRRFSLLVVVVALGAVVLVPVSSSAAPAKCSGTFRTTSSGAGKICKFVYKGGKVRLTAAGVGVGVPRTNAVPNFIAFVTQFIYKGVHYCIGYGPGAGACVKTVKPTNIPKGTVLECIGGVTSFTDAPRFALMRYSCENV